MRKIILFLWFFSISQLHLRLYAQDSLFLKVHFLYGSKPLKKYKKTEKKWFGGVLGGHVGIETQNGQILNFMPNGKFHIFAKKKNRHSSYVEHSNSGFYSVFGGNADSVKKVVVFVPISKQQKQQFDSITGVYLAQTPYDYAFFGMRCGAATYETLGKLAILPSWNYGKTWRKIFIPKKLRKRLLKKANSNNWKIIRENGSEKRKWEKD